MVLSYWMHRSGFKFSVCFAKEAARVLRAGRPLQGVCQRKTPATSTGSTRYFGRRAREGIREGLGSSNQAQ